MRHPEDDEEHAAVDLIDDAEVADADPISASTSCRMTTLLREKQEPI
jgi:hypothetical protein